VAAGVLTSHNIAGILHQRVLIVLLDLGAAFDTIDHVILLGRLESRTGIRGAALLWLNSYLGNRTIQVTIGSDFSDPVHQDIGVPQRSVLSPLLFLVYILPVGDILLKHNILSHCGKKRVLHHLYQLSHRTPMQRQAPHWVRHVRKKGLRM